METIVLAVIAIAAIGLAAGVAGLLFERASRLDAVIEEFRTNSKKMRKQLDDLKPAMKEKAHEDKPDDEDKDPWELS